MNPALLTFTLSLFFLVLILLESLHRLWDRRFGTHSRLQARLAHWAQAPAPLSPPAPPLRPTPAASASPSGKLSWLRSRLHRRKLRQIALQLPEGIDFISRALRAGHDLPHALTLAAAELRAPLAHELHLAAEEIGFGAGLPLALEHLAQRIPLPDLQTFVIATRLHRETGGDITRVFDRLAALMRERADLRARIRILSAEGRLSAWILSLLPVLCALLAQMLHPGLLGLLLQDAIGQRVAIGAALAWVLGIVLMQRITALAP